MTADPKPVMHGPKPVMLSEAKHLVLLDAAAHSLVDAPRAGLDRPVASRILPYQAKVPETRPPRPPRSPKPPSHAAGNPGITRSRLSISPNPACRTLSVARALAT